jgi:N-acetyl-anhydromuramyl-L-alanine amidase AmpD
MTLLSWLYRKLSPARFVAGPPATSPTSSTSSTPRSTGAPKSSERAKQNYHVETHAKTPNVSTKPITPRAVVLHHSGGSYAGGVSWIKNPASRVSYHVLVAADGRRTVFAEPTQRTWHAGKSAWHGKPDLNSWSIGAAFAGDTYAAPLTDAAMDSMAEYLASIMRENGLTLAAVTDHRTVSPGRKDDLKPSELDRFRSYLAARL